MQSRLLCNRVLIYNYSSTFKSLKALKDFNVIYIKQIDRNYNTRSIFNLYTVLTTKLSINNNNSNNNKVFSAITNTT